jgi:hypothetical protein
MRDDYGHHGRGAWGRSDEHDLLLTSKPEWMLSRFILWGLHHLKSLLLPIHFCCRTEAELMTPK